MEVLPEERGVPALQWTPQPYTVCPAPISSAKESLQHLASRWEKRLLETQMSSQRAYAQAHSLTGTHLGFQQKDRNSRGATDIHGKTELCRFSVRGRGTVITISVSSPEIVSSYLSCVEPSHTQANLKLHRTIELWSLHPSEFLGLCTIQLMQHCQWHFWHPSNQFCPGHPRQIFQQQTAGLRSCVAWGTFYGIQLAPTCTAVFLVEGLWT